MRWAAWLGAATLVAAAASAAAAADLSIEASMAAALPGDGQTDLILVDRPWVAGAPRVRVATTVAADAEAVTAALLDPARYRALIPALVRSEVRGARDGDPVVVWELEVPLFNLSGRFTIRQRANGVTFELLDGDFAPGRIYFSVAPRARGCTLIVDAQLDVRRSSWLLRRIIARSPAGEPAALAAAAYVAARATALRAEHPGQAAAFRPTAAMAPAEGVPDPAPLDSAARGPLGAHGVLALVSRSRTGRLAGVAAAIALPLPVEIALQRLRDPSSWRAFPGWPTIRRRSGPVGIGAEVEDDLPLLDFDATWRAESISPPSWSAIVGATRGARLGWTIYPLERSAGALAVLQMYPRIEATGMVGRRFISAEPLLEGGLALSLALADVTAMGAAMGAAR